MAATWAASWPPTRSGNEVKRPDVGWREWERSGAALGVALALKLFAWPVALWLVATKRIAAALASVGAALVLLAASWTAVGFAGLREYPDLLDRLYLV